MPIFPLPVNDKIRTRNLGIVFEISLSFPSPKSQFNIRSYRFLPPQYLSKASIYLHLVLVQPTTISHLDNCPDSWSSYMDSCLSTLCQERFPFACMVIWDTLGVKSRVTHSFQLMAQHHHQSIRCTSLVSSVTIFSLYPASPLFSSLILLIHIGRYTCKKYNVISALRDFKLYKCCYVKDYTLYLIFSHPSLCS